MDNINVKKYSANYANTNHNFVIQNLEGVVSKDSKYYSSICIVKNIIQRGKPTLMSTYLQNRIGTIHKYSDFSVATVLISDEINTWKRIIRGCEDSTYNPAYEFFENVLDEVLGEECKFIKNLIIPEVLISDITQENKKEFKDQQVDFYLPQAYLVIEIDGIQHQKDDKQKSLDKARDQYLTRKGIEVVRISVQELKNKEYEKLYKLRDYVSKHKILTLYKKNFSCIPKCNNPILQATSVMRYQILVLELLKYGRLSLDAINWEFELNTNNEKSVELLKIAITDLFIWFSCILKLQNKTFKKPNISIKEVYCIEKFSDKNNIKLDFSILKRYTDENQNYPNVIFIRTDYFDKYKFYEQKHSSNIQKYVPKSIDYSRMEVSDLVKYNLTAKSEKIDNKILKYLMWNLFLQSDETLDFKTLDFREGQLSIIKNVLNRQDTIGLLPTGSGKSICYQLAGLLQPAPSVVVAPIVSLMQDQVDELNRFAISRVATINANSGNKFEILDEFAEGRYFFIFISPERFQSKSFRNKLKTLNKVAYAVIDEAHCLSEWGHDFRTSYLTLIKTIRNYCNKDVVFLALTATASLSVLKDLKLALDIYSDFNVKTPLNFCREELEFKVIESTGKIKKILVDEMADIIDDKDAVLIFTPYASDGAFGCRGVCNNLNQKFPNSDIRYFSGQLKDSEKKEIQDGFKNNEFNVLVSTKAFGMGVNKGNIRYTFHYGIPSSLEALYQEAGRAGRAKRLFKKKKAKCFVLFSPEYKNYVLEKIWDVNTSKEMLLEISKDKKKLNNDVSRQLFFLHEDLKSTDEIVVNIMSLYDELEKNNGVIAPKIDLKTDEKYLYRLYQLGIITDWTVDYSGNLIETDFKGYPDIATIRYNCELQIKKYDPDFSFESIHKNIAYKKYAEILDSGNETVDKYIRILAEWGFDKFVGYRRQSLKNVYEACANYVMRLKAGEDEKNVSEEFKRDIEGYFTVNESSQKMIFLSENPSKMEKCFELFYVYNASNKKTNIVKPIDGIIELKNILMRLLEEYPKNYALNLVSGLVRFMLDEFDNKDGKDRFIYALESINRLATEKIKHRILLEILKICKYSDSDKNKVDMASVLFKYYDMNKYILVINKYLNDSYTNYILAKHINEQMLDISRKLLK